MRATTAINPCTVKQQRRIFWLCKQITLDLQDEVLRHSLICEWTDGRASRMRDLCFIDAMDIIRFLESMMRKAQNNPHCTHTEAEMDRLRKGCIKAVFAWLEICGFKWVKVENKIDYVIGIICRSAGCERKQFNSLTPGELTRSYNEFCRKQSVNLVKKSEIEKYLGLN